MSAGPRAPKERVDVLVVRRGLAPTRQKAQALVMAGQVFRGDERVDKPGAQLPASAELVVRAGARFVSRGGDKLEGALAAFAPHGLEPRGKVCLDVGASTGGFTDCLLAHGAARVYAVDVGHGQLHPRLRADPRVVVREGVNARALRRADFPEPLELVVVDASFISLGKLLPALAALLEPGGELVALVKPQFEAGRKEVSRGRGVIRDAATREAAIATATDALAASGLALVAAVDSAVHGPKGNVERFVLSRRSS